MQSVVWLSFDKLFMCCTVGDHSKGLLQDILWYTIASFPDNKHVFYTMLLDVKDEAEHDYLDNQLSIRLDISE